MKSRHQSQVEAFMLRAKQEVPVVPAEPSESVRILRAKLMLEEVLETIRNGLGVAVMTPYTPDKAEEPIDITATDFDLKFIIRQPFNMLETIDGCCDVAVVTTGTLSACGISDIEFQNEVNENNLKKFGPGHKIREDGKLIKPPNHQPPNLGRVLDKYR